MGQKYNYDKERLTELVANSICIAEVLRKMGLRPVGGNYKSLKQYIKKWEINTSHFTGQAWNKGVRYKQVRQAIPLEEILKEDSSYSTDKLRVRLLKEKYKLPECEQCNLKMWNNLPIPLELHHIDGNNTNNKLENLQIICPNCHAQTDNYRGKGKTLTKEKNEKVLTSEIEKIFCKECGKEVLHNSENLFCSLECYNDNRSKGIPKVPEIIKAFEDYKTFMAVGRHFNVTDNTVRKWIAKYGIQDIIKNTI